MTLVQLEFLALRATQVRPVCPVPLVCLDPQVYPAPRVTPVRPVHLVRTVPMAQHVGTATATAHLIRMKIVMATALAPPQTAVVHKAASAQPVRQVPWVYLDQLVRQVPRAMLAQPVRQVPWVYLDQPVRQVPRAMSAQPVRQA